MSKLSRKWRRLRQSIREWAGETYELDGSRFVLPPWADDIKRNIKRGHYEAPERRLVARWLKGDLPVVELGGAFGIVSGVVGARLGPGTPHVIVEANPVLVDYCRRNAIGTRGADAPVSVLHAAVAYGSDGVAAFMPSDAFLGSRLATAGERGAISVPTVTLAALVAENRIGRFDLVCDIEGAELDILVHDAISLSQCRLAIIEVHPDVFAARGTDEAGFVALLIAAGFDIVDRDENVIVAVNRAMGA